MTAAWVRSGSGPAHLVITAGSEYVTTACKVTINKKFSLRVKTMYVEGDEGHFYRKPANCETCPHCEVVARMEQ